MRASTPELSLEERLMSYLRSRKYIPQDFSALARGMGISSTERPRLRALLSELIENGQLNSLKGGRISLPSLTRQQLTGKIRSLPGGRLVFKPNEEGQKLLHAAIPQLSTYDIELPIQEHRSSGALDGDIVRATLHVREQRQFRRGSRNSPHITQRPPDICSATACVEEILQRKQRTWVGYFKHIGKYGYVETTDRKQPSRVKIIAPPPAHCEDGMLVVLDIVNYPIGKMEATGTIRKVLGFADAPGVDLQAVINRFDLPHDFPPEVLTEANALPHTIADEEYQKRYDQREELVITIDPESAQDFDDAISIKSTGKDTWELSVHIADVGYYVKAGSALDTEANKRGNSTYLPGLVIPMLPPVLCNNLCSLIPGKDRLTKLCILSINKQGKIFKTQFFHSVIRSRCRLNYDTVQQILEEKAESGLTEVDHMLRCAAQVAEKLRTRRMANGAVDLNIPEIELKLDANGAITDILERKSDRAHRMIEEFMLAANEAVALSLSHGQTPAIYRVHEEPDPEKLAAFARLAQCYGLSIGAALTRREISETAQRIHGHPDEEILSTALLRAMMRARYSTQTLGHYGLAMGPYCHFTSPIRRYADLIIHRAFDKLAQGKHASVNLPAPMQLSTIAEHISETERISASAEKEAQQRKIALFLAKECEQPHPRAWTAVITDSYPQGLSIELPLLRINGFIHADELEQSLQERFFFEPHTRRWSGVNGTFLLPGNKLQVIPVYVDTASFFADFRPVLSPDS